MPTFRPALPNKLGGKLLGFAIVMASVMMGGIYYQTSALRNEFNARFVKIDQQFKDIEKRIDLSEKNLNARFEDLNQEVRAGKK